MRSPNAASASCARPFTVFNAIRGYVPVKTNAQANSVGLQFLMSIPPVPPNQVNTPAVRGDVFKLNASPYEEYMAAR